MITEEAKEQFEKYIEDITRRNLAIAKFLGWYQKRKGVNVWYLKDETGNETMVWSPMYNPQIPDDSLPFFHDLNMLNIVMEVLPTELGFNVREIPMKEGKWYTTICMMSPVFFSCFLFKSNGRGGYADSHVLGYNVGIDVGSYREGLFKFLSDIILIMQNKYDEQNNL